MQVLLYIFEVTNQKDISKFIKDEQLYNFYLVGRHRLGIVSEVISFDFRIRND